MSGKVRRKPERASDILQAAFEEFVLHGYAATRLEDVAARAGMTKGAIYFHFQNKEEVFVHMVRELSVPRRLRFEEFLRESPQDAIEFLTAFLTFTYEQILSDRHARETLRLLIAEATRFPELVEQHFNEFINPILSGIRTRLEADAREGKVRKSPVIEFPDVLFSPVLTLNVLMLIYMDPGRFDPERHLAAAKDLLLYGLLPRPGEA